MFGKQPQKAVKQAPETPEKRIYRPNGADVTADLIAEVSRLQRITLDMEHRLRRLEGRI